MSAIPFRVTDLGAQLQGKRLTTAEVLYYMPDHPDLLQSFLWQTLDQGPDYPRIQKFLAFWRQEIDAVIHSVEISSATQVTPGRTRSVSFWRQLN